MGNVKKQNTLTVKLGDKDIVSKPFDFEALCLINDAHGRGESGAVNLGHYALPHMFKGTAVTDEVLNTLSIPERGKLCAEIFGMYIEALTEINKNAKN